MDGYINADVFFTPAMISANNLKAGVVSSYDVTLQSPMNRSFAITDWQTNNPAIEVNAQRNERSSVQHIIVKVHAPENGTVPSGRIIFTLDDGRQINLDVIGCYWKRCRLSKNTDFPRFIYPKETPLLFLRGWL